MLTRIKVVDIELSRPLTTIEGLDGYTALKGLVRLHGTPIGYVDVPITVDHCSADVLSKAIVEQLHRGIVRYFLSNGLAAAPQAGGLQVENLLDMPPPTFDGPWPLVTVAVCTRDRTDDLALCLKALQKLDYPNLEILVVDNAPSTDATKQLVAAITPAVRYVCESRPGLDWARNRASQEASGEIIAYTDDDVIVDAGWVKALVQPFLEDSSVMAVTGLVVPYELETEAQVLFELYGGFGRGFRRRWCRVNQQGRSDWEYRGTGQFGTGANMAYRRRLFELIGPFDPALDVGTVTNGGGDLEMFFRVLKEGYTLVYEPSAIVRHRHRREYDRLRTQITNNGIGFYSFLVRSALVYPEERWPFFRLGVWWLWWWLIRRLLLSFLRPSRLPRELIWTELWGVFKGLSRYQKARRTAVKIVEQSGADDPWQALTPALSQLWERGRSHLYLPPSPKLGDAPAGRGGEGRKEPYATAVRVVDISQPLAELADVTEYASVRIFVTWTNQPLGQLDISNYHQPISGLELRDTIVDVLILKLLEPNRNRSEDAIWADLMSAMEERYAATQEPKSATVSTLPTDLSVSVVVATYDRPDDLEQCLKCLIAQQSPRKVEIVVVDNHPASGQTPPVVAQFPGVLLVNETRQGLSYARNAGIRASSGDIIVATDDDVTMPPDWLEKLIAPFSQSDVMVVTGNTLPAELETVAQHLFELYGGLGRGFEPKQVDGEWFESFRLQAVPTWILGATANAAFRRTIFSHREIGLIDEALGAGTPTGCSEDTYLFYRVLKAGYTLFYEPTAFVWHKHRRGIKSLHRQLYNYSKGHVAYHLTTLLRDHDLRALTRLLFWLPYGYLWRIVNRVRRQSNYPLLLIMIEIAGNLVGPFALLRSHWRVRQLGRSQPYLPPRSEA